ncbi:TPM domain-containing protein [Oligoflexaceae bacterium]|nr:TPM domain-containing protein [Oligoflexaceae bacterium]
MILKLAFILLSLPFASDAHASNTLVVPALTPNVVDMTGTLNKKHVDNINVAVTKIRKDADIWGAVFVVDSLQGESIESLAERTFRKWKLGDKERDNGLLLVLALSDRQSRFEVGYGLEGEITDLYTKRVLDTVLRKNMRSGDTEQAILSSLYAMAAKRAKSDAYAAYAVDDAADERDNSQLVLAAYGAFLVLVWIFPFWLKRRSLTLQANLKEQSPHIFDSDLAKKFLINPDHGFPWFIKLFFSVNPGIFIVVLTSMFWQVGVGTLVVVGLIAWVMYKNIAGRFRSRDSFQKLLNKRIEKWEKRIAKGHAMRVGNGGYDYTPAYRSSRMSRFSGSSSSSRSSSSSSSSGGGSSGGGGASSSW